MHQWGEPEQALKLIKLKIERECNITMPELCRYLVDGDCPCQFEGNLYTRTYEHWTPDADHVR